MGDFLGDDDGHVEHLPAEVRVYVGPGRVFFGFLYTCYHTISFNLFLMKRSRATIALCNVDQPLTTVAAAVTCRQPHQLQAQSTLALEM